MFRKMFVCIAFLVAAVANAQDMKNPTKMAQWAGSLWEPVMQAAKSHNRPAQKIAEQKAIDEFAKIKGQRIDWVVKAGSIQEEGLSLSILAEVTQNGCYSSIYLHGLGYTRSGKIQPKILPLPKGTPWVLQLKKGDLVRVEGRIGDIYTRRDSWSVDLNLLVEEPAITPAKR